MRTMAIWCVILLVPSMRVLGAEQQQLPKAPEWFNSDPADPDKILSEWKSLTTTEAAVYLGPRAHRVLAGILLDQDGHPLPLTLMTLLFDSGLERQQAQFCSDQNGYFIVYGPWSLSAGTKYDMRSVIFSAYPGFPVAECAVGFSRNRRAYVCTPQLLAEEPERSFYALSIDNTNTFDPKAFEAYLHELAAKKESVRKPWRNRPQGLRHESYGKKTVKFRYELKLVDSDGTGVEHALVKFTSYDSKDCSNDQIVETNDNGECTVKEYLLADQPDEYYRNAKRSLCIDAPGQAVGPLPTQLKTNEVNTLRLSSPASVSGTVCDHNGLPLFMDLRVEYKLAPFGFSFETWIQLAADRSFTFDRIMPGQEFRLVAQGNSGQVRRRVCTEWMVLNPGEHKEDIKITVPLASALYVICIDERGERVKDPHITLLYADGGGQNTGGEGFFIGLDPGPFRVEAYKQGIYTSEPLQLQPGELRVLRAQLLPWKPTNP